MIKFLFYSFCKICMRLIRGVVCTSKWEEGRKMLLKVLNYVVFSWEKHQKEIEEKIAQEKSIYINKLVYFIINLSKVKLNMEE